MSYQEFLNKIQRCGSKPHNISHCYGARDAWKWVRKNKWESLKGYKCSSSLYGAVIDEVNKMLSEKLLEGHSVDLPHQMGTLRLIAKEGKTGFLEGKIRNNYRVDWKKTLECWYEDDDARKQKIKIKRVQKYIYSLEYLKQHARYRNQKFYQFRVNRSLVRALGDKIENERLNALIY